MLLLMTPNVNYKGEKQEIINISWELRVIIFILQLAKAYLKGGETSLHGFLHVVMEFGR